MFVATLVLVFGMITSRVEARSVIVPEPSEIVGGRRTAIEDACYQVALLRPSGFQFCGGSLIGCNPGVVLTAAHCIKKNAIPSDVFVGVGHENKYELTKLRVKNIICHKRYNNVTKRKDICLLILDDPIPCSLLNNGRVCTTEIAAAGECVDGKLAKVTGWGVTEFGSTSYILLMADVVINTEGKCKPAIGSLIKRDMICASSAGKDSCQGDSGGPLVVDVDNKKKQCGIVSWGYECAHPDKPGVYANASKFTKWMTSQLKRRGLQLKQCSC